MYLASQIHVDLKSNVELKMLISRLCFSSATMRWVLVQKILFYVPEQRCSGLPRRAYYLLLLLMTNLFIPHLMLFDVQITQYANLFQ